MTALINDWKTQKYHFSDGSCVFLVSNEIFKIHRSLLEQDSGFFKTLFSLPQSNQGETSDTHVAPREGESEENPIVCHDTLLDFKALCWGLYARPMEVAKELSWNTADIPKLIGLFAMTHKYEFNNLRDWVLDLLDTHCATNPSAFLPRCGPWAEAGRLLTLSDQCGRSSLVGRIQEEWLKVIGSYNLDAFNGALDTVEGLPESRQFHGNVYLEHLGGTGMLSSRGNRVGSLVVGDATTYIHHSTPQLNELRLRRLHGGFWSLMRLHHQLLVMPGIGAALNCKVLYRDLPTLQTWWTETIGDERKGESNITHSPLQLCHALQRGLGKLNYGYYNHNSPAYNVCATCKTNLTTWLEELARKLVELVPDHFNIPTN